MAMVREAMVKAAMMREMARREITKATRMVKMAAATRTRTVLQI